VTELEVDKYLNIEIKKVNEERISLAGVWKTFHSHAGPLSTQLHCSNLRTSSTVPVLAL